MFYKHLEIPVFVEIDNRVLGRVDKMLTSSHLFFSHKTLVTSPELYTLYSHFIDSNKFDSLILVQGGKVEEYSLLKKQCDNLDTLFIAFGGGSILDIVKYAATDMNIPYIAMPSTLSNDAIYSPVARLTCNGKKKVLELNLLSEL
ncbi:iron-containing alcohol dehydrogenase [Bacteroides fragilis]|uniref:iron-containing alcohol dehydrogenase n=1 Tax=Bacteroides hominis TaxID=2763023 RepID=UPI003D6D93A5|nr:iron-containing alcohol dehydrogenase [Bacteroides fragilis]